MNRNGAQIRNAIWQLSTLLEDVDAQDREIYAHGGPCELEQYCKGMFARRFAEVMAQEEGLSYEQ